MAIALNSKIYIAGHRGLLGSAVLRKLQEKGFTNIATRTSKELDLLDQQKTSAFIKEIQPDYIYLCAAKVGGIKANMSALGEFLYKNMVIQTNVIESARLASVKKLLFVASTCIYPTTAPNPLSEDSLMSGPVEKTNEGYAVAKLAGVKMCELYKKQYNCNFISAVPCNLFGKFDHYDTENSHVLQSLIRKVHDAKTSGAESIELWGSGKPRREFMLSDDCADALLFLMESYDGNEPINVGTGTDASIVELATTVARVLNHKIDFKFDATKPDGMMRKLSDVTRLTNLGWKSKISLEQGIKVAYEDFLSQLQLKIEKAA